MTQCPTSTVAHRYTTLDINDWHLFNQLLSVASVHVFNILSFCLFMGEHEREDYSNVRAS
jgi:hypothetical protein